MQGTQGEAYNLSTNEVPQTLNNIKNRQIVQLRQCYVMLQNFFRQTNKTRHYSHRGGHSQGKSSVSELHWLNWLSFILKPEANLMCNVDDGAFSSEPLTSWRERAAVADNKDTPQRWADVVYGPMRPTQYLQKPLSIDRQSNRSIHKMCTQCTNNSILTQLFPVLATLLTRTNTLTRCKKCI